MFLAYCNLSETRKIAQADREEPEGQDDKGAAEGVPATRMLHKHGITSERVLREIDVEDSSPIDPPRDPPTRETLNALVGTLPEAALEQAFRTLEYLQRHATKRLRDELN